MKKLETVEKTFRATDKSTELPEHERDARLNDLLAPKEITLKVGAQVMLIKNLDNTLVNGLTGKVKSFKTESEMMEDASREDEEATTTASTSNIDKAWPVVHFIASDGEVIERLVTAETFKIDNAKTGGVLASRTQVSSRMFLQFHD